MQTNDTRISDQYAAALFDTRARFHYGREVAATLQLPQRALAEAFIEHVGAGELTLYRKPERSDRIFNNITISEEELPGVLKRLRPYMISSLTHDADLVLGLKERR